MTDAAQSGLSVVQQAVNQVLHIAAFYRSCAMSKEQPHPSTDEKYLAILDAPFGTCACGEEMDENGCPHGH